MTAKKESGPTVEAFVDEAAGKVTIAVRHGDKLLPVATAEYGPAAAREYDPDAVAEDEGDEGKEG